MDSNVARYLSACRSGDLNTVKELIEGALVDIKNDFDSSDMVSGLHYASAENRLNVIHYLVSRGANINARLNGNGSTPLHWAVRFGYVYCMDYLLNHGADPSLLDEDGLDMLHLSVKTSNIVSIIYVIFFIVDRNENDINSKDTQNRTALHYAVTQGDYWSVFELLKYGADVNAMDVFSITPLYIAIAKGNEQIILLLIKFGANLHDTIGNQDYPMLAEESHTLHTYQRALERANKTKNGYNMKYIMSKKQSQVILFLLPTFFITFTTTVMKDSFVVIIGLGGLAFYLIVRCLLPSFVNRETQTTSIMRTPLPAGIFISSVISTIYSWLIISSNTIHNIWNFIFFSCGIFLLYLHVRMTRSDPGYMYTKYDHDAIRKEIKDLIKIGKFDVKNFCLITWSRIPLRCRLTAFRSKQVLRLDHYCPWIYNDIGLKNHKLFIYFLIWAELFFSQYVGWALYMFYSFDGDFEDMIAKVSKHYAVTLFITIWVLIQFFVIGFFLFTQIVHIVSGLTSIEYREYWDCGEVQTPNSNVYYGMNPKELAIINGDNSSLVVENSANTNSDIRSSITIKSVSNDRHYTFFKWLGLDLWSEILDNDDQVTLSEEKFQMSAPLRYGWKRNLKDFLLTSDKTVSLTKRLFCSPKDSRALLNGIEVDYSALYEIPTEATDILENV